MRSQFNSTTGGVMTVEAGSITGELEISTTTSGGAVEVSVRYAGTEEWYVVEGSPASTNLPEKDCHDRIIEVLTTPGEKRGFNEDPITLPAEISGGPTAR